MTHRSREELLELAQKMVGIDQLAAQNTEEWWNSKMMELAGDLHHRDLDQLALTCEDLRQYHMKRVKLFEAEAKRLRLAEEERHDSI